MKLNPVLAEASVLDAFRRQFANERPRHVVVPQVLSEQVADDLRSAANTAGFEFFELADRGRFGRNLTRVDEELFGDMRDLAARLAGRALTVGPARWLRLSRGDYALMKYDARERVQDAPYLEATLDFSVVATDQAEFIYTDGNASWPMPQLPGTFCLIERAPSIFRYERYLNLHVGDAVVYRLHLSLLYA